MNNQDLAVYALADSQWFGKRIVDKLGVSLGTHEEITFDDGEHRVKPLESVRGKDVYVVQSLYDGPEHCIADKLVRLLFFVRTLKDASAERVTIIAPYLAYSRLDRQVNPRDPVASKYIAILFESIGADRVLTMDVHNLSAFQNAFRCNTDHFEATSLFVDFFSNELKNTKPTIVSPDVGGIKRAKRFQKNLSERLGANLPMAFADKVRIEKSVAINQIVGDVKNCDVIIYDDMISSGQTMFLAAKACKDSGARKIYLAATHGLFAGGAEKYFQFQIINKIIVTNSISQNHRESSFPTNKFIVLDSTRLFSEAIKRLHSQESISDLLAA